MAKSITTRVVDIPVKRRLFHEAQQPGAEVLLLLTFLGMSREGMHVHTWHDVPRLWIRG